MRNKILVSAAAAFILSSGAALPPALGATPGVAAAEKAARQNNPAVADDTISRYEAKDAKKQAHRAHKKAKVAHHKAKIAAKAAAQADSTPPASR